MPKISNLILITLNIDRNGALFLKSEANFKDLKSEGEC